MTQRVREKLFSGRKVFAVLLLVSLLFAVLLTFSATAEPNKATLTVTSGSGAVGGGNVWVSINLSDVANLEGVTKISGGYLELVYDPAIADVTSAGTGIVAGSALTEAGGFIVTPNNKLQPNVLCVAWAGQADPSEGPDYGFHADGEIIRVRFTPVAGGVANLVIQNAYLIDQDVNHIPAESLSLVNGTLTITDYTLPKVSKPTWDGYNIQWVNVPNAKEYRIRIYKSTTGTFDEDGYIYAYTRLQGTPGEINSFNLITPITNNEPGYFFATVQAIGDDNPYKDGPVSEPSDANLVSVTLDQVAKPTWDGWKIKWVDVPNAESYEVKLFKGATPVATKTVNPGVQEYDFTTDTADAGTYTATVQAIGDGTLYLNGPVSPASDGKIRAGQLPKVDKPTWSAPGVINWTAVGSASSYKVVLYEGINVAKEVTGVSGTSYNFLSDMRTKAGSYTVTVQAIGDGVYFDDGPASDPSDAQVVAPLPAPASVTLSDTGVAGWSAVTGADGYTVNLYKDGSTLIDGYTAAAGDTSRNLLSIMRANGVGSYHVEVAAIGTGLNLNSSYASSNTQSVAKLAAPTGVALSDQGVASWNAVTGAASYMVYLYKEGIPTTIYGTNVPGTQTSADVLDRMLYHGEGIYTVKVKAVANTSTLFLDSDESAPSAAQEVKKLSPPTGLTWDGHILRWTAAVDDEGGGYRVQLYFNGVASDHLEGGGLTSNLYWDFSNAIAEHGAGYYYAEVVTAAIANSVKLDSDPTESEELIVSGNLADVTGLVFSESGVASWDAVPNATNYEAKLWKVVDPGDDEQIGPTHVITPPQSLQYDFRQAMRSEGEGTYYVTVQAFSTDPLFDPSAVAQSGTRTVTTLATPVVNLGDTGIASWAAVPNAAQYEVGLYRNGILVAGTLQSNYTGTNYNYLDKMREQAGDYTIKVTAKNPASLFLDRAAGESNAQTVTVLAQVGQPNLGLDGVATWTDVPNASSYSVQLYKDSVALGSPKTALSGTTGVSFLNEIKAAGEGSYTVRVTAKGQGLFLDGPASVASPAAVSRTLDQVGKPAWDVNNVKPAWPAVDGATNYKIVLYTPTGTFTYYSDSTSYDGDDLHIPYGGLYYYTVQALGTGIVLDGPVSDYSDILAIADGGYLIMAEGNNAPYTASGFIPFLNTYFKLSDDSPFIGVFEASVYGQSGLGAPAERKPAGIFLDIEPGDGIAGVMLYMEVGYDPAALPKGMSESSLRLYHYVDGGWHLLTSGVNTDSDYVWAEVDSFSTFGVFGRLDSTGSPGKDDKPLPKTLGYLPYLVLLGLLLGTAGLLIRRKILANR